MINRTRMLLDDLDSEGFPIPYPREFAALAAVNIGRIADHAMVQAILADHKCLSCGLALDDIGGYPTEAEVQQARHLLELAEQRKLVDDADAQMDQFVGKAAADHFRVPHVERDRP